jgi:HPt (histidine-containing phosphotransfer) domain-containing protein
VIIIDSTTVLDRQQLRDVTLDDPELMREIVAALIDDTSRQIMLLDGAIHARNSMECARLAHYSKGACANLGANSSAALLKRIEVKALTSEFGDCRSSLVSLEREMELLRVESASL